MLYLIKFELEEVSELNTDSFLIDAENERDVRTRFVNMLQSQGGNATIIEIRPINSLSDLGL